jgi:membrane fusion protein (multidrug efflux system)
MKRWYVAVTLFALFFYGSVIGFNQFKNRMIAKAIAGQGIPPAPVVVSEVKASSWQPAIGSISFIEPVQGVELSIAEAGLVTAIHFESGDWVEKGQLLLELDSTVEQANLNAARARLPAAKRNYERALRLYKNNTGSRQNLDDAESLYKSLIAQIESLESTIARRRVLAPFAGKMGLRDIDKGQFLQGGTIVGSLQDISAMRVRFFITQERFTQVDTGMPVEIRTDAYPDKVFQGRINAIDPLVDPDSGVINVQAEIPNPEQLLRSGMYAETRVLLPTIEDALVIPTESISFSLYGEMIFVVENGIDESGKEQLTVQQRRVVVKERRGDVALVETGLSPGERIVTSGHVRLNNGIRVYIVEQDFVDGRGELPID